MSREFGRDRGLLAFNSLRRFGGFAGPVGRTVEFPEARTDRCNGRVRPSWRITPQKRVLPIVPIKESKKTGFM